MPLHPIQTPDPTEAVLELYDIVGKVRLALDEIISPVAIIDDGWARVTYFAFALSVPASTAAASVPLHVADPNFSFKLLFVQYLAAGGMTGEISMRIGVLPSFSPAFTDLRFDQIVIAADGVTPSNEILGDSQPTCPPSLFWELRHPLTGIGETLVVRAILARIPRRMRP